MMMRTWARRLTRGGIAVVTALLLVLGVVRQADAQTARSDHTAQATDTSWFAKYHPAPRDTLAPAIYLGWEQFEINCSRCHGENAEGSSFAPSLVQALGKAGPIRTEEAFLAIACAGVPEKGMPSWCALGLGMDKLKSIYQYVNGRADGTIHPGHPALKQESTATEGRGPPAGR
jgi:mono/diheme cytochrome c family protein